MDMVTRSAVLRAATLDVLAIVCFVAVGRRTHDEDGNVVLGLIEVAAPFLIAAAIGWLVGQAWRAPAALTTGAAVWVVTVALGMLLRRFVFDRGTATSFVVVATIATGVLLLGWRLVAKVVQRARRSS